MYNVYTCIFIDHCIFMLTYTLYVYIHICLYRDWDRLIEVVEIFVTIVLKLIYFLIKNSMPDMGNQCLSCQSGKI